MAGILEGIRVVEMGHVIAVPAAGATFADWGAEVIKVEPLTGELLRGWTRTAGVSRVLRFYYGDVNWNFLLHNRNKKSLAVDLKREPGRAILYKLVQESDIFLSNYELAALKSLKLEYETLSQLNPRIVYGVLTGYGTAGPDKDERGFDYAAAWARAGTMSVIGEQGAPPPPQRGGMLDRVTAAQIVAGTLAAIIHRDKTGKGQQLEFSLYHTGVWTIAEDIQSALVGTPFPRQDRTRAHNPLWNTYRAEDDRWFQLVMARPDSWPGFCKAMEITELENDPRFDTAEMRQQHCEELVRILDEIFATRTGDEWERLFRENDFIYGRVQSLTEVTTDPQATANDFFAELDHPVGGPMKLVNTPVKFCQDPASVRAPAPELGQHTEEILLDLGYNWEDISQLKEQEVIL